MRVEKVMSRLNLRRRRQIANRQARREAKVGTPAKAEIAARKVLVRARVMLDVGSNRHELSAEAPEALDAVASLLEELEGNSIFEMEHL